MGSTTWKKMISKKEGRRDGRHHHLRPHHRPLLLPRPRALDPRGVPRGRGDVRAAAGGGGGGLRGVRAGAGGGGGPISRGRYSPLMISTDPPMSPYLRRWMLFVDGENLTLRAQALATKNKVTIKPSRQYIPDVFIWPKRDPRVPELYGLPVRAAGQITETARRLRRDLG